MIRNVYSERYFARQLLPDNDDSIRGRIVIGIASSLPGMSYITTGQQSLQRSLLNLHVLYLKGNRERVMVREGLMSGRRHVIIVDLPQ